jgi:hypothetical protein
VLALSLADRGFEPRSGQNNNYKISICCFSAKHTALRRKNKDWLARNQNNVSEWSDMSTRGLLFQWDSTIKIQLSKLVKKKADLIIISLKINLFSPWYSCQIAELAINYNHSLTHSSNTFSTIECGCGLDGLIAVKTGSSWQQSDGSWVPNYFTVCNRLLSQLNQDWVRYPIPIKFVSTVINERLGFFPINNFFNESYHYGIGWVWLPLPIEFVSNKQEVILFSPKCYFTPQIKVTTRKSWDILEMGIRHP